MKKTDRGKDWRVAEVIRADFQRGDSDQDLNLRSQLWKHWGKSIPDSIANAKALRQELVEHVPRTTRRPWWPEGYEGREGKGREE